MGGLEVKSWKLEEKRGEENRHDAKKRRSGKVRRCESGKVGEGRGE